MTMLLISSVANAAITNPNTLVFLWNDDIRTLDPAYVGSTPGSYAPLNTHDRLLNYDGKEISEFLPGLSAVVPTVGNGLIQKTSDGKVRYSFPIRSHVFTHQVGVKADNGSVVWKYYDDLNAEQRADIVPGHGEITAGDVKYAFMRAMLQGESWMANAVTEMISAGKYADIEAWAV
jgi:peptide/nickel transport system substrate-binding protein